METDPFFNALATVVPIAILVILGLVCIYSVVGVPLGLILLGVAVGMIVGKVWNHYHPAAHF